MISIETSTKVYLYKKTKYLNAASLPTITSIAKDHHETSPHHSYNLNPKIRTKVLGVPFKTNNHHLVIGQKETKRDMKTHPQKAQRQIT